MKFLLSSEFLLSRDVDFLINLALLDSLNQKGVSTVLLACFHHILSRVEFKVIHSKRSVVHSAGILQQNVDIAHGDLWNLWIVETLAFHFNIKRKQPCPHSLSHYLFEVAKPSHVVLILVANFLFDGAPAWKTHLSHAESLK